MAKDDRFTVIAGTIAVLITAGLFLWSHWGSTAFSTRPTTVAGAIEATADQDVLEPTRTAVEDQRPTTIVPALFEVEPAAVEGVVQASNRYGTSVDHAVAVLEGIASGRFGAGIPAAAEILVRRDRDGRIVVAAGTHRRYTTLRRQLENLDHAAIDAALQKVDGTTSSTDVESLRAHLVEALDETLAVGLPEVEPDMVAGVHAWQFADAQFRGRTQAGQHLLLMGRANAAAVYAKLAEVRRRLGASENSGDADQPVFRTGPVVIAQSSQSEDPPTGLIEP